MKLTVGDIYDNLDKFCGYMEIRIINSSKTGYVNSVPSPLLIKEAEVHSIRTIEDSVNGEAKTAVYITLEELERVEELIKPEVPKYNTY